MDAKRVRRLAKRAKAGTVRIGAAGRAILDKGNPHYGKERHAPRGIGPVEGDDAMVDKHEMTEEELAEALRSNIRLGNALLASGRLTPSQEAGLQAITDLTTQTINARDDASRVVVLLKLARSSLMRSEIARRLLALDEIPPELRKAITDMLLRRGEPI